MVTEVDLTDIQQYEQWRAALQAKLDVLAEEERKFVGPRQNYCYRECKVCGIPFDDCEVDDNEGTCGVNGKCENANPN